MTILIGLPYEPGDGAAATDDHALAGLNGIEQLRLGVDGQDPALAGTAFGRAAASPSCRKADRFIEQPVRMTIANDLQA
jgi:hypothetical protein